ADALGPAEVRRAPTKPGRGPMRAAYPDRSGPGNRPHPGQLDRAGRHRPDGPARASTRRSATASAAYRWISPSKAAPRPGRSARSCSGRSPARPSTTCSPTGPRSRSTSRWPEARRERSIMSRDVDVVVVGGRVAGASTAMLLARQGHRVLALDRAALPSDTVSTHALLRSGVLQLRRWGLLDRVVDAGTPPVRAVTLGCGDQRVSIEIRLEHGIDFLMAPRRVLPDRILLDAPIDSGVVFRGPTHAVDLSQDRRGSGHVVLSEGEGGAVERVSAHVDVGADGGVGANRCSRRGRDPQESPAHERGPLRLLPGRPCGWV